MLMLKKQKLQVENYLVGDQIKVGKYTATCQAVADGKAVFLLDQYLDKAYPMNSQMTSIGGYEKSELRAKIKNAECDANFSDICEHLVPFDNGDLLRIPTVGDMFGTRDTEQWILMKERRNRIADRKGEAYESGWLQNEIEGFTDIFALVNGRGLTSYGGAAFSNGVRPAFQLG